MLSTWPSPDLSTRLSARRAGSAPRHSAKRLILSASLAFAVAACASGPDRGGVAGGARPGSAGSPMVRTSPETRQCLSDLGQARVNFIALPDQYFGGGCSQLGSVRLASIGLEPGRGKGRTKELAVANLGPVTCPMARTFTGWAQYGAARAAEQILGSPLVRIETFGSFNCRTIAGSAKLSQHAHANAIDVSAFVLADGRRVTVKDGWNGSSAERQFLRIVHQSACKRFGTVLGPDYNAAHRDHLHLDLDNRNRGGAAPGKPGYCR